MPDSSRETATLTRNRRRILVERTGVGDIRSGSAVHLLMKQGPPT